MPATNLVELCKQFLTPEAIGVLSSNLHMDPHTVESAAEGAVPALLASMGAAVGRPGGDRQLADAMAQAPQGSVDEIIHTAAEQSRFGSNGSSALSGLLSSRTQDSLAHAIGQYAHIGDGDSRRLLGVLGPAVLGMLARQRMSSGLDAIGLADLLSSQRRKIADAIPQELAEQMSASGLGDALRDRPRMATSSAGGTASTGPTSAQRVTSRPAANTQSTTSTTHTSTRPASTARRGSNAWLYWLLGLAALAAIAFYAIGNRAEREVAPTTRGDAQQQQQPQQQQQGAATDQQAAATDPFTVGGVNVRDEVTQSMDSVRMTLTGITDEASARAAMPDLREATTRLDNVTSLARQLPEDGRRQLASVVSDGMPALEREFDRLLGMPGVNNVVRPAIEGLRTRMQSLAST